MSRFFQVLSCATLVVACGVCGSVAFAQNPFGEGVELSQPTPAEVTLEVALPADPGPAPELALAVEGLPTAEQEFCHCVGEDSAPTVERIRKALGSPLSKNGLDFNDAPLEQVLSVLQEEYGIPVKIDTPALDEIGISSDAPVSVNLRDISLRAGLKLMLKGLGLTYVIEDEVLMITTPGEAETKLKVCVYDVRNLIDPSKSSDMDSLRDTIVSCVATESWAANGGGEAEIRSLRPGLLVISQTRVVHDEVRALLETIRRQLHTQVPREAAIDGAMPGLALDDDARVVTRSYILQIQQPGDAKALATQIRELITTALPNEQWAGRLENGEPIILTVLPDRIVLRHRQSVQDKVATLLSDSNIATAAPEVAGGARGGAGFFNVGSK